MDQTYAALMSRPEHREEMIGTWLTMALVVDEFIRVGLVNRETIIATLADAEAHCSGLDRRHLAMGAVRRMLETIAEGAKDKPRTRPARRRTKGADPQGGTQAVAAAE
jgi:hypothetical protein